MTRKVGPLRFILWYRYTGRRSWSYACRVGWADWREERNAR